MKLVSREYLNSPIRVLIFWGNKLSDIRVWAIGG